jgi:hypothetical protein
VTKTPLVDANKVVTISRELLAQMTIPACVVPEAINELDDAFAGSLSRPPVVLNLKHLVGMHIPPLVIHKVDFRKGDFCKVNMFASKQQFFLSYRLPVLIKLLSSRCLASPLHGPNQDVA